MSTFIQIYYLKEDFNILPLFFFSFFFLVKALKLWWDEGDQEEREKRAEEMNKNEIYWHTCNALI